MSIKITKKNLVHLSIASFNLIYQANFMLPAQAQEEVKIDPEFSKITHESCHSYEYKNQKFIDCVSPINIQVEPLVEPSFKVKNTELEHRKIIKKSFKNENLNLKNQPIFFVVLYIIMVLVYYIVAIPKRSPIDFKDDVTATN